MTLLSQSLSCISLPHKDILKSASKVLSSNVLLWTLFIQFCLEKPRSPWNYHHPFPNPFFLLFGSLFLLLLIFLNFFPWTLLWMLRILERIEILLKSLKEAKKNQQTIFFGGMFWNPLHNCNTWTTPKSISKIIILFSSLTISFLFLITFFCINFLNNYLHFVSILLFFPIQGHGYEKYQINMCLFMSIKHTLI